MKKLFLVVLFSAATALAIWFGMRSGSPKISSTTVTALLPRETVGFLHVPDVSAARAKWHESDIYKLWREPAMQEFLRKPLAQNPKSGEVRDKLQKLDVLGMRDVFFAVVAWQENDPKFVSGFRFKGTPEEAGKVIDDWRVHSEADAANVRREAVTYEEHRIDVT